MYIVLKWITWLYEQQESGNAFRYSYNTAAVKYHVDDCYFCCVSVTGYVAKYVVGSKSFRPDQRFKVTEIKQLCYVST